MNTAHSSIHQLPIPQPGPDAERRLLVYMDTLLAAFLRETAKPLSVDTRCLIVPNTECVLAYYEGISSKRAPAPVEPTGMIVRVREPNAKPGQSYQRYLSDGRVVGGGIVSNTWAAGLHDLLTFIEQRSRMLSDLAQSATLFAQEACAELAKGAGR